MSESKFNLEEMKAKIVKLLAKAEGNANTHEREAFMDKAEALMLKLGVARAELESVGQLRTDPVVEHTKLWKGNYSIVMLPFTARLARGFGDLTVLQYVSSPTRRWSYIIGHQSDVEQFMVLLESLSLQAMLELRSWQKEKVELRRDLTDMQKFIQNRSFIEGFGARAAQRVEDLRGVALQDVSPGAALVLVSKRSRVDDWVGEAYPNMKPARGGTQYHSQGAFRAGVVSAENADLGLSKKVNPNNTKALV